MISKLHIEAASRNGKAYLKNTYHTTPFKVANVTEDKGGKELRLMVMSSSPGVLDEDDYDVKVDVEEECVLEMQTQSFQRLFNMKKGASQSIEVNMKAGSSFCFLPHPVVPHDGSKFISKNTINITEGCKLIWGEVLTCGRKLSGELFKFSSYQSITKVIFNNRLVVKENLLIQPSVVDVNALGQLEGYTHQASLLYINKEENVSTCVIELNEILSKIKGICFGVSALPRNGLIVRLLGCKAEQLYRILKDVASVLRTQDTTVTQEIKEDKREVYAT